MSALTSLADNAVATAQRALAVDGRSLNALKTQAVHGNGEAAQKATREAALQLESLFMRELIKSMRDATVKSGMFDGAEGNLANDMFDQQMSVQMAGLPGGLADAIQRQLAQQLGAAGATGLVDGSTLRLGALRAAPIPRGDPHASAPKGRDDFVQHHRGAAERVARASGIPASFMLGQAGHETGWGKSQIRTADGGNSFNLFGIKAGGGWSGKVAQVTTTEYVDGQPRKVVAKFRAYDSFEESFRDYARLISENPRYARAMENTHSATAYAAELQKAGYATDPQYAAKLGRAIRSTLTVPHQAQGQGQALAQLGGSQA